MVALKIEDMKAFTNGVFIGTMFDSFLLREAEVITFNRFFIDGRVRQGYYSDDELEEKRIEEYSAWSVIKPVCFSLIKGKRLPESFKLVFQLPPENTERFVMSRIQGMQADQVNGLYINVHYENQELTCVSGTSLKIFTLDKTLEREWDESMASFLKKNEIAFSQMP